MSDIPCRTPSAECAIRKATIRLDIEADRPEDIIRILADALRGDNEAFDADCFVGAVMKREEIQTTAMRQEVAFPHARLCGVPGGLALAVGVLRRPVTWGPESLPIRIVFLIGSHPQHAAIYLTLLRTLSCAVYDEKARERMAACGDTEVVRAALASSL